MEGGSPTIQRRRLGRALRDLRKRKGLTGDEAGVAVERSGSWVSRVEGGRVGLRGRDLRDLLDLYGLEDPRRREELEGLAREGKQRGWWSRYTEILPESLVVYVGLEAAALSISSYVDKVVPGLLQTKEYCRALHRQYVLEVGQRAQEEVEARVQFRMARQAHLEQEPPGLRFLLDEAVLYRTVGGSEVFRKQLEHLLMAAERPHIGLRVVPFAHSDRIVITGSYSIIAFRDDQDIACLETVLGMEYKDGDKEVETYRKVFENLTAAALEPAATIALIKEVRDRLS